MQCCSLQGASGSTDGRPCLAPRSSHSGLTKNAGWAGWTSPPSPASPVRGGDSLARVEAGGLS